MNRLRACLLALAAFAMAGGLISVPAQAGNSSGQEASVSISGSAKKKCKKFKGKKKRQCLKNSDKGKGDKGGKPWDGSPYKPGITCSLSPEMHREYVKHGLFCLDLGLGITPLEPL